MTKEDFGITFCTAGITGPHGNIKDCPVADKCRRNWTIEHNDEARRLGLLEHSIYIMVDPDMITENGCMNFLEK